MKLIFEIWENNMLKNKLLMENFWNDWNLIQIKRIKLNYKIKGKKVFLK